MESFLNCKMGSSSMMEYILRMKTVAAAADPISEWDKIVYLVDGLGDDYAELAEKVKSNKDNSTLDSVCSLLLIYDHRVELARKYNEDFHPLKILESGTFEAPYDVFFEESRCRQVTAEVYAKANLFPECLRVCLEGGLYDLGMEYIKYWKQEGKGEEIYQHEQDFLLSVGGYCSFKAQFGMMEKVLQGVTANDQLLKAFEDYMEDARNDDDTELLTNMKKELLRKIDLLASAD